MADELDVNRNGPQREVGQPAAARDEFKQFLIALAVDPIKLGAFLSEPDAAMRDGGLNAVDQFILKSGNSMLIHSRIHGQRYAFDPSFAGTSGGHATSNSNVSDANQLESKPM